MIKLAQKISRKILAADEEETSSNALKRELNVDYQFKARNLKPLAKILWSLSVSLGHLTSAASRFFKLKSVNISPDGALGGKGYVRSIKTLRKDLYDAEELLSSLIDTIHDEVNADHWKAVIKKLPPKKKREVQKEIAEADEIIHNPKKIQEEEDKYFSSLSREVEEESEPGFGSFEETSSDEENDASGLPTDYTSKNIPEPPKKKRSSSTHFATVPATTKEVSKWWDGLGVSRKAYLDAVLGETGNWSKEISEKPWHSLSLREQEEMRDLYDKTKSYGFGHGGVGFEGGGPTTLLAKTATTIHVEELAGPRVRFNGYDVVQPQGPEGSWNDDEANNSPFDHPRDEDYDYPGDWQNDFNENFASELYQKSKQLKYFLTEGNVRLASMQLKSFKEDLRKLEEGVRARRIASGFLELSKTGSRILVAEAFRKFKLKKKLVATDHFVAYEQAKRSGPINHLELAQATEMIPAGQTILVNIDDFKNGAVSFRWINNKNKLMVAPSKELYDALGEVIEQKKQAGQGEAGPLAHPYDSPTDVNDLGLGYNYKHQDGTIPQGISDESEWFGQFHNPGPDSKLPEGTGPIEGQPDPTRSDYPYSWGHYEDWVGGNKPVTSGIEELGYPYVPEDGQWAELPWYGAYADPGPRANLPSFPAGETAPWGRSDETRSGWGYQPAGLGLDHWDDDLEKGVGSHFPYGGSRSIEADSFLPGLGGPPRADYYPEMRWKGMSNVSEPWPTESPPAPFEFADEEEPSEPLVDFLKEGQAELPTVDKNEVWNPQNMGPRNPWDTDAVEDLSDEATSGFTSAPWIDGDPKRQYHR